MKNFYAPGFYALLAALTIISGAIFWSTWTSGKSGSTQDAFAFINSLSALIQALAAGIVAWLAYRGLSNWKQELIHSKAQAVVWDASIAFRKIEASIERLALAWNRNAPQNNDEVIKALEADLITSQFDQFLEQCQIIDKIVLSEGWAWAMMAKELRSSFSALAVERHKPRADDARGVSGMLNGRTEKSLDDAVSKVSAAMEPIKTGLKDLSRKYAA